MRKQEQADPATDLAARARPRRPPVGPASPVSASAAPAGQLPPASVGALQRSVGNAAVTRLLSGARRAPAGGEAPVVQRYVEIDPGAENYPSKHRRASVVSTRSAESDDQFFPSQQEANDSWFADAESRTPNLVYNGSVRLRLSDALDLAVEQGTGESKVFFATERHIQAANRALGGRVRLQQGSRFLRVRGESGERRLYQVKPVVATGKQSGVAGMLGRTKKATGLSVLTPQRCNEMAEFVTGKMGLSARGISAWENFLARVLDLLDGGGSHQDGLKEALRLGQQGDTQAYLAYSRDMSRTFQDLKDANSPELEAALRQLGLNEFMPPPPPGSALVTVGYGDAEQEGARDRDSTFEYHFGATIATSGNDYVTMENYARRDAGVGNATASGGDPLFFFRMYGTRPESGETWHGAQEGTGGFIGAILSLTLEG